MQRSECINELAAALAKAQSQMKSAHEGSLNPHFKSRYADLDACWDAVREPLTSNGLSVTQWPSAQGKMVSITTTLMHTSGQWISGTLTLMAGDETPQKIGACITYGRRYGLCCAVGITSDQDDDGNTAQPNPPPSYKRDIPPPPPVKVANPAKVSPETVDIPPPPPDKGDNPDNPGFDPNVPSHMAGMVRLLNQNQVPLDIRDIVLKEMIGRHKEDLMKVVEDVMYPIGD